MDKADTPNFAYRLRRDAGGLASRLWQSRWIKALLALAVLGLVALVGLWFFVAKDLPDAAALTEYEPPLPTIVRDFQGEPFHSYARERRVQLQYADFPPLMVRAYLAAEDRTFFQHGGLDYPGHHVCGDQQCDLVRPLSRCLDDHAASCQEHSADQ